MKNKNIFNNRFALIVTLSLWSAGCFGNHISTVESSSVGNSQTKADNAATNSVNLAATIDNNVASPSSTPTDSSNEFRCEELDKFEISTVDDPPRRVENINLIVSGKIRNTIIMPNDSEVGGFALDWAKKTKRGFEVSIEYGSRYYFAKRFIFICKKNDFFLDRIKIQSFDKAEPEKWTKKDVKVKPMIPVSQFSITDYTKN